MSIFFTLCFHSLLQLNKNQALLVLASSQSYLPGLLGRRRQAGCFPLQREAIQRGGRGGSVTPPSQWDCGLQELGQYFAAELGFPCKTCVSCSCVQGVVPPLCAAPASLSLAALDCLTGLLTECGRAFAS